MTGKFLKYSVFIVLQAIAAQGYAEDSPYRILQGKLDQGAFEGWQVYQDAKCGLCHGESGESPGPFNLVERLKQISKKTFVESVLGGKGLMSPYLENQKVAGNIDKIYAYLKARSDGAVGAGKPNRQ